MSQRINPIALTYLLFSVCFLLLCHGHVKAQCPPAGEPPLGIAPVTPSGDALKKGRIESAIEVVHPGVAVTVTGDLVVGAGGGLINCGTIEVTGQLRTEQYASSIRNYGTIVVKGDVTLEPNEHASRRTRESLIMENHGTFTVEGSMTTRFLAKVGNYGTINVLKNYKNDGWYNYYPSRTRSAPSGTSKAKLVVGGDFISGDVGSVEVHGSVSVHGTLEYRHVKRPLVVHTTGRLAVENLLNNKPLRRKRPGPGIWVDQGGLVKVSGTLTNEGSFKIDGAKTGVYAARIKNNGGAPDLKLCWIQNAVAIARDPKQYPILCPPPNPSLTPAIIQPLIAAGGLVMASTTPVELLFFRHIPSESNVTLAWKTASERNSAYFNLYRSSDGATFEKIKQIKGHGTTQIPRHYRVTDLPPWAGTYYYQLEQVDYDGENEFFPVIKAKWYTDAAAHQSPSFYPMPTPAGENLFVQLALPQSTLIAATVTSITGQTQKLVVSRSDQRLTIPVAHLSPGVYLLKLTTPESEYQQKIKIR